MKNSNRIQPLSLKKGNACTPEDSQTISIEECKKYLGKFGLSDEKIIEIRNYLTGIIDKSINLYLDDFR